jgi:hypothetical protein
MQAHRYAPLKLHNAQWQYEAHQDMHWQQHDTYTYQQIQVSCAEHNTRSYHTMRMISDNALAMHVF